MNSYNLFNHLLPWRSSITVWDLDGTLSDDRWRAHLLPDTSSGFFKQEDFDKYHAGCVFDEPIKPMIEVLQQHALNHEVVYLTARPVRWSIETVSWLNRHNLPSGHLIMRGNSDTTSSRLFKSKWMDTLMVKRHCQIALFADDRDDVIEAATERGIANIQFKLKP